MGLLLLLPELDSEPLSSGSVVLIILLFVLLLFLLLIAGADKALHLLALDKDKADNTPSPDRLPEKLYAMQDRLQASFTVWINLLNVTVVASAIYLLERYGYLSSTLLMIGTAIGIILVLLFFEEIFAKISSRKAPMNYLRTMAPFLFFLERLSRPVASLLIVRQSRLSASLSKKTTGDVSVDELSKALELTSPDLKEEREMLEGIIGLYNKTVVEVMTSRLDVKAIKSSLNFREVIDFIVEVAYSRIPVYGEHHDDIKGILYIKDLLPYLNQGDSFHWQKLIRPAFFVPENKKIDDLLEEFRTNKIHLAVVVDEFGGTSGIITMEDILEEIVGEINDEYDEEEDNKCLVLDDGTYNCDARILLTDFFKTTAIDPKDFGKLTDEVDTLAGLVLEIKGDFPEEGEVIAYGDYRFHILEMEEKRILRLQVTIDETDD